MVKPEDQLATKARILIIDGDTVFSNLLGVVLHHNGFDVAKSSTAKAALRLLEDGIFDVVLSDADLPDSSGAAICKQIRMNPRLREIPVILMSGGLEEDESHRAFEAGAANFISKPFRFDTMVAKVHGCLKE